jgi:serine phosphatase RsbU (regulator of sigma subunit)
MQGVVAFHPDRLKKNPFPPPVVIEEFFVNRRPWLGDKAELVLPADSRDFEFQYTALSFSAPERVQFRYRLEGFDRDWVDVGRRRVAYYTNHSAGDYRFRVISDNEDGVWNDTGATLAFHVTPYFYKTTTFYVACGLALLLFVSIGYRVRVQKLKDAAELLEAKVRERTLELTVAYRELAEKDQRISEDLAQAEAFQQRILAALPQSPRVGFAAIFKPAEAVGGDVYDVCEYAPGRFRVFIADTTGHGVQASLRTMVLKTEYDRLKHDATDPGTLLSLLNDTLYAVYPGLEMRCSACCFDVEPREDGGATVRYANAAHPPLLHVTEARVHEVYQPGPFLAMVEKVVLLPHTFTMKKGERLLAYTDGLCEQEDPGHRAYGIDRISTCIARTELDLHATLAFIVDDFTTFAAGQEIADDVAMVAAELR